MAESATPAGEPPRPLEEAQPAAAPRLPPADAAPAATAPHPAAPTAPPALRARPRLRGLPPAEDLAEPARATAGARGLVSVIIPAKNEETGIGATLRSLPLATLATQGFGYEVLVLDGASHDKTRDIAAAWGAQVLEQVEPGKGAAVRSALPSLKGDYVVMLDADATYPADAIPIILEHLAAGDAEVVMGSRRRGGIARGAMGPLNKVGNVLLSSMASVLYFRRCSDVCTGLWGFRTDALRALPLEGKGFELEVELFGRSARAGLRVREVPVDYLPRRGGTKLSRARDGLRIGWWLLRTRFAPPRPPGAARPPSGGAHARGGPS